MKQIIHEEQCKIDSGQEVIEDSEGIQWRVYRTHITYNNFTCKWEIVLWIQDSNDWQNKRPYKNVEL